MTSERRKLQKELAQHLRDKDRATLRELRACINTARVTRRHMLTDAREQCRSARLSLRDQQKQEREWFRDEQRGARAKGKTVCELGKENARKAGTELEHKTKAELRAERTLQRQVRAADQRGVKQRSTKRERSQEDDDAVTRNLPGELVPVFLAVKKKIKAGPRRSRTEAFLEWAEENPGEILALQEADAEQHLRDLLKAQKEHGVSMRKAGRYKGSPEELRELLAGVPF